MVNKLAPSTTIASSNSCGIPSIIPFNNQIAKGKLKTQYNSVDITVGNFVSKTVIGSQSGTKALVLNTSAVDSTTGEPNTI